MILLTKAKCIILAIFHTRICAHMKIKCQLIPILN